MSDNSDQRKKSRNSLIAFTLVVVLIAILLVVILALLGPVVGNVFSNTVIETQGWIRPLLGL